jgi:hypothetical protein
LLLEAIEVAERDSEWRLTARGLKVARQLYPEEKKPTKRELARNITWRIVAAESIDRQCLEKKRWRRRRRRKGYAAKLELLKAALKQNLKRRLARSAEQSTER